MNKLLKSGWLIPIVGTLLYIITTMVLLDPAKLNIPKIHGSHDGDSAPEEHNPLKSTPWDFNTPEIDHMITELKAEKERLAGREKELNEMSVRIQNERTELQTITQEVSQLQYEFNQVVTYVKEQDAVNQKKLAKTYAAMTPEDAALIMKQMDDGRVVRLLMFMNEAETAKILSTLAKPGAADAKRAAMLSERLRLSVQAPATGKPQSSTKKQKSPEGSPLKQLVRLNHDKKETNSGDFAKMARSYAALPPVQAVNILEQLQDEQMAGILAHFTEDEMAPILVELSKPGHGGPQRAARVAELVLTQLNS
jgi:flagellar motility protein MotE (MotC chaperone)